MDDVDTLLNRLCHLMVAFERTIGDLPDGPGTRIDLDMPGLAVLVALDLFGEMRPTSVALLLGGTTSMTTKVLGRLERDGRLERRHGAVPDDRRAVTVQLTDRGRSAIARCEVVLAELSVDLLASIAAVSLGDGSGSAAGPTTPEVPGDAPPTTGPGLAEFLRFVVEIDKPLLSTVGNLDPLHPRDPRGLLVLSELDRRGPRRAGTIPGLIDRSRSAAHRLCTDLEELGLVARGPGSGGDRRRVEVEITEVGRAVLHGSVAAVAAHLPELRPSMLALSRALAGNRQGLGAPAS